MKIAKRDKVYNHISKNNSPALTVSSGEIFKVETELNGGTWLNSFN